LKQQPDIPAFGDWETSGNTPYTQKFENARKNKRTGIPSKPNDLERHAELPLKSPLHQSAYKPDPRDQRLNNPPHTTRPKTDQQRLSEHSTQRESAPRRRANPQWEQGGNVSTLRSPYRASAEPASPMQQNHQARLKHRSTGMQTPERRISSEGHGQHTPGRSRKPSGRGYEVIMPYSLPFFSPQEL
jgi:RPM1-interacting protein 4